jgi:F-type H+-transporting ATPase subunit a
MQTVSEPEKAEKKKRWRWGVNRWILLLVIIFGCKITSMFPPARPAIFLPAEAVIGDAQHPLFYLGQTPFYITNTLIATAVTDIILLLILFFSLRPALKKGYQHAAKGVAGLVEAFSEILYNLTESTAGKWTKTIFPWFAAITIMVLMMNWMELIPGVDSIGAFSEHHAQEIENFDEICNTAEVEIGSMEIVALYPNKVYKEEGQAECAHAIVPYVRATATDLNFTVGLALVSVIAIQVMGVKASGISYFEKFIYVRTLFSKPIFGIIDFLVGLFEVVSELSKIISFSFRLFGNIFAGAVLLFVLGTLIPVVAQAGVLLLEFAVGLIQAIVFGMLTMIFMSQATYSHHGEGEDH